MWRRRFAVAWIGEHNLLYAFFSRSSRWVEFVRSTNIAILWSQYLEQLEKDFNTFLVLSFYSKTVSKSIPYFNSFSISYAYDFHANTGDLWFYSNGFSGLARNSLKYLEQHIRTVWMVECRKLHDNFRSKTYVWAIVRWTHESYCLILYISSEKHPSLFRLCTLRMTRAHTEFMALSFPRIGCVLFSICICKQKNIHFFVYFSVEMELKILKGIIHRVNPFSFLSISRTRKNPAEQKQ